VANPCSAVVGKRWDIASLYPLGIVWLRDLQAVGPHNDSRK
jgi:hypothetical protein